MGYSGDHRDPKPHARRAPRDGSPVARIERLATAVIEALEQSVIGRMLLDLRRDRRPPAADRVSGARRRPPVSVG
jgi:hypothetical protein